MLIVSNSAIIIIFQIKIECTIAGDYYGGDKNRDDSFNGSQRNLARWNTVFFLNRELSG